MREKKPLRGGHIGPLDWLKTIPFAATAASERLGWVGLEAARYRAAPASEYHPPAFTHHWFVLFIRPPENMDLEFEGVKRHLPPPAGSVVLVPAGSQARWRLSGPRDTLNIYLDPGLVGRAATEAFDLDPARLTIPPLGGLDLPHLRTALLAVDAEMTAGGSGGRLAAESLANVLAVYLIRHALAPHRPERGRDGALPQGRLHAVLEYIEEHLDACPTLEQMAAVTRRNSFHFARQFKAATGLPPHQYVIMRRVERAKHLLQGGTDRSLAEVAAHAGFSDQSQFCHHFKRIVGLTPRQFGIPSRTA